MQKKLFFEKLEISLRAFAVSCPRCLAVEGDGCNIRGISSHYYVHVERATLWAASSAVVANLELLDAP